jgi:hypothetical protein
VYKPRPFFLPLFTHVPVRGNLKRLHAESCINLPFSTSGGQLMDSLGVGRAITTYRALNKPALSWITL